MKQPLCRIKSVLSIPYLNHRSKKKRCHILIVYYRSQTQNKPQIKDVHTTSNAMQLFLFPLWNCFCQCSKSTKEKKEKDLIEDCQMLEYT